MFYISIVVNCLVYQVNTKVDQVFFIKQLKNIFFVILFRKMWAKILPVVDNSKIPL